MLQLATILFSALNCVQSGNIASCITLLHQAIDIVQHMQAEPPQSSPVVSRAAIDDDEQFFWDSDECL